MANATLIAHYFLLALQLRPADTVPPRRRALAGAKVVINVIKVIGRHAEETRKLFEIATWNLLTAEQRTGSVTTSSCPSLE